MAANASAAKIQRIPPVINRPAKMPSPEPSRSTSPIQRPTPSTAMPERLALQPMSAPRRLFETVLPSTSFAETEQSPRARLKMTSMSRIAQPAAAPSNSMADAAMPNRLSADRAAPSSQTPLRTGRLRTAAATASCGSKTPASRIGTRNPVKVAGTPSSPNSQGITSFALAISSATLFSKLATR